MRKSQPQAKIKSFDQLSLFLHVDTVSILLGLHRRTIQRMAKEGTIPARQVGKSYIFDRDELFEWVEAQRVKPFMEG